jgi:hypothetical protein
VRFLAWSNGAALALLGGVAALVVVLYLLRPLPRRLTVSSSLLWEQVLRSRKRRPERWRWWLSLLLALAIASCLALALSRPEVAALSGAAQELVIVVDDSATMATRTVYGSTRFEEGIKLAREAIERGGPGSRFMVADTLRQIGTPSFQEREAALSTLRRLKVRTAGVPAFPHVARPLDARANLQVLFVTDGVAGIEPPPGVKTMSAYHPADNVGIGAFDVRPVPGDPARYQAFVEVLNASAGVKRVELRIAGVGAKPAARQLHLGGRERALETLDVSAFDAGVLRASVQAQSDAFDLDNAAYAVLPMKRVVRVALVTRGSPALERSLRLVPRVQVTAVAPERFASARGFDAAVLDQWAPRVQPAMPVLLVRPGWVHWLPAEAGETGELAVERWDAAHPLLRNLSLRDLVVEKAAAIKPGVAGGEAGGFIRTIASGPREEPLLLEASAGARWVQLAFALEDSNFAQLASFPVFLSNAVDWMTGEPPALERALGRVRVPLAGARVTDLAGKSLPVSSAPGATLFDAQEPGVFTAITPQQRLRIVVNALDPALTLVNASALADAPPSAAPARAPLLRADPWVLLLIAAVALLCVEWLTFHRRVTV